MPRHDAGFARLDMGARWRYAGYVAGIAVTLGGDSLGPIMAAADHHWLFNKMYAVPFPRGLSFLSLFTLTIRRFVWRL